MMKNKLWSMALIFILVLTMGLGSILAESAPAVDLSGKVIGLSLNALDEYQTEWRDLVLEAAKEAGVGEVIVTNAEGKVDKQLADVESLIAREVDLIIMRATDSEGAAPALEMAENAGIPTIDSGFGTTYENTFKIMSSQYYLTSLQGDFCNAWLDANPDKTMKAGYLWGAQGVSTTAQRYYGWKETVEKAHPDRFEVIAEKVANWSAVEAMTIVEDWMQAYPEMNAIVAMSDEMAIAATNVLGAVKKLDDFIVVGIDGSPNAQQLLREGILDATVYTSKKADAQLTVDYAVKILQGEDLRGIKVDPGEQISALMTKDNIDEVLEKLN